MYKQGHVCVFTHTYTFIFLPHIPYAFTLAVFFFTLHALFHFRNIQLFFFYSFMQQPDTSYYGHPSFIKSDQSLGDAWGKL